MSCGCSKNNQASFPATPSKPAQQTNGNSIIGAAKNLIKAASTQKDKIKWFKDGVTGIVKAVGIESKYTDEQIQQHRDICRNCEHSTKTDGKLTSLSQCMAIDPNTNQICGCFILQKTQVDQCPLKLWPLTISIDKK